MVVSDIKQYIFLAHCLPKHLCFLAFLLFLVELSLLLGCGVLVLLVLGHQVVHVRLGLCELHLVHALAGVPMQKSLATEHGRELLRQALEQLLYGGTVADERTRHLQTTWWDVAHSGLDVVRDPFHEVAAVLVLYVQHLLVNFFHGHAATEHGCNREVATVARIAGGHHVLGVEHLLCKLWHGQGSVLLAASGREWREAGHEEVKTWEWYHVDGELPEISVQLAGESEAGRDARHCSRDQMVEITVRWCGQFECAEADVVQSLVVDTVRFICVLNKLVDGQCGVIRLNNCV